MERAILLPFKDRRPEKQETSLLYIATPLKVAYTTSERSLEMETLVKAFDASDVDPAINDVKSVVGVYYGRIDKNDFGRQIKIGFGQQGDKFYQKTSFSVWSVLVGVGPPPEDEISSMVRHGLSILEI